MLSAKSKIDRLRSDLILAEFISKMPIVLERREDAAMSELLRDDLQWHPLHNHMTGIGVPKAMKRKL